MRIDGPREVKLIFEESVPGRTGFSLPPLDVPAVEVAEVLPEDLLRTRKPELPEVSEVDVVRHFTRLSERNHGVDSGFYPLGSCTMKYNPKINEDIAALDGFTGLHPYQPEGTVQGALRVIYELQNYLSELMGMDAFTLQPAAGAHGELTGLMLIKAYHRDRGQSDQKQEIIVPDSAHGTNPASAAMCGFKVVEVPSDERGNVDVAALKTVVSERTAGLMLTNPNTLGLFEENILEIADIIHAAGGLLYYDGANANAILGITRPGDMGFDVVHLNLHKTFAAPHGGGGPGSGPVGVKADLIPYLPVPRVQYDGEVYHLDYDHPKSIGKVKGYCGNFLVALKAYAYIRQMGSSGLRAVAENAVLNANYLLAKLQDYFDLPYRRRCMHEFVISGSRQKAHGVKTLDMAKRLLDFGVHAPTIYFPLIVEEALMIEPTETESKETMDQFITIMAQIAREAQENPEVLKQAPRNLPVRRLDEAAAARHPNLKWQGRGA
ncbi:MAG: aminomethyl-transferring glycine dehydrogenase subunit GcvPB [Firmicutes bacterium]|nr:aminomethyl-transferring glycine dehydrogenase subunit GcvPB [Bacillota bacterium]